MSLQLVANHLAQKGRGPDSTLVHMSNREVAGLQALAQKHGGELSVNPDTGLPEAGFLDNILPAIAGAGLSYISGGAISPLMAGGIIGGITALDSKDLTKGLVAGLGAYGGSGMVGGLAGLGGEAAYMPGAAGEAARAAGTEAAIANGTYQSQVGTGLGNFIDQPKTSLSTLGGGSALKGSLPILAGLAPAAAEAIDAEEDDGAPAQHKGYIRKYAFDPVTGQYKQVGAYEAGGDPNVDVSAKAGTAGSYGGVGQSEYEAAQGMAAGGTTDSSRIYDYLMGRGPNPMQFTRAAAPTATVAPTPPVAPITPTTPILEEVYDPYGNIQQTGGNGQTAEEREAYLNETLQDYGTNSDTGNLFTRGELVSLTGDRKKEVEARFAEEHPIKHGISEGFKTFVMPGGIVAKAFNYLTSPFQGVPVTDNRNYVEAFGDSLVNKDPFQFTPSMSGPEAGREQTPQQKAEQDSRIAAFDASRESSRGGGGGGMGGDVGSVGNASTMSPGGGYFSKGGIANLHQYNLGSYSDGGRLLKGPGDGVSDDIPATIGNGQPARLADGEFVIPARIVSELGNGSTDAGARELYKMMDRIQAGRKKTVGKDQVAKNSKAARHLPA